jgi:hypothetical protein
VFKADFLVVPALVLQITGITCFCYDCHHSFFFLLPVSVLWRLSGPGRIYPSALPGQCQMHTSRGKMAHQLELSPLISSALESVAGLRPDIALRLQRIEPGICFQKISPFSDSSQTAMRDRELIPYAPQADRPRQPALHAHRRPAGAPASQIPPWSALGAA